MSAMSETEKLEVKKNKKHEDFVTFEEFQVYMLEKALKQIQKRVLKRKLKIISKLNKICSLDLHDRNTKIDKMIESN